MIKGRKIAVIILFFFLGLSTSTFAIVLAAMIAGNQNYKNVENIYYDNKDSFSDIYDYMKGTYSDGIVSSILDLDDGYLSLYENNVPHEQTPKKIDPDEPVMIRLKGLYDKYLPDSAPYVFNSVTSYFDESGNMMMYFYAVKKKNDNNTEKPYRNYCLVCVDDGYSGYSPNYLMDPNDANSTAKPFISNWYVWSYDSDGG